MKLTTRGGHLLCAPGYDSLSNVLCRAFVQASAGKGRERHANELPFDKQPMQTICSQFGVAFALGQATKKAEESQGLPHDAAVAELLGAINYLAGAVIFLEGKKAAAEPVKATRRPSPKPLTVAEWVESWSRPNSLLEGHFASAYVKHPTGCKCGDSRECLSNG